MYIGDQACRAVQRLAVLPIMKLDRISMVIYVLKHGGVCYNNFRYDQGNKTQRQGE